MKSMKEFALLVVVLFCVDDLSASSYKCNIEFHKESFNVKNGALICGEFVFDTDSSNRKSQTYDQCNKLTIDYTTVPTPNGVEKEILLSAFVNKTLTETSRFVSGVLPTEFRIEKVTSRKRKKQTLSDSYILKCKQS